MTITNYGDKNTDTERKYFMTCIYEFNGGLKKIGQQSGVEMSADSWRGNGWFRNKKRTN